MSSPLRVYDRSRVTTDWTCERRRYWQYEHEGKGLSTAAAPLELFLGTVLHDGLAAISQGVAIDAIAEAAVKETLAACRTAQYDLEEGYFAEEQAALIEGLLRGFAKYVWPSMKLSYPTIVATESEMTYAHDGLTFMAKPDLIVADADGVNYYVEYKSTSSKREDWINSWDTAVQLHSTIKAVKATKGIDIQAVLVQGLYKGYPVYGKQSSIFCYGYHKPAQPPFSQEAWSYEYRQGYKKAPIWEREGGVKAWVANMPDAILAEQFPQCPPVFLNDPLIERFFAQRTFREHEIDMAVQLLRMDGADTQGVLDAAFQQNFSACQPGWGKPCPYRRLCFGPPQVQADPLKEGYTWRVPHHALEVQIQQLGGSHV